MSPTCTSSCTCWTQRDSSSLFTNTPTSQHRHGFTRLPTHLACVALLSTAIVAPRTRWALLPTLRRQVRIRIVLPACTRASSPVAAAIVPRLAHRDTGSHTYATCLRGRVAAQRNHHWCRRRLGTVHTAVAACHARDATTSAEVSCQPGAKHKQTNRRSSRYPMITTCVSHTQPPSKTHGVVL
jgi:hypothetical protein